MIKLIVFDVYGTLLYPSPVVSTKRLGVKEFLEMNPNVPVTYFTDAEEQDVKISINEALLEMGILKRFRRPFYYFWDMDFDGGYKDLDKVASEFGVNPYDIVLIGDSKKEFDSARRYKSKVIIVPSIALESQERLGMDNIGNVDNFLGSEKAGYLYMVKGRVESVIGDYLKVYAHAMINRVVYF